MAYPIDPIYKLQKETIFGKICAVNKQIGDSEPYRILSIPFDEANTDYQEYLEWAKTNTAEEAD